MPERVPGDGPESTLVGCGHTSVGFATVGEPVHEGAVHRAAGEEVLVEGVPGEGGDFALVAAEGAHELHGAQVEELEQLVAGAGQQPIAVLVAAETHHGVLVSVQGADLAASARIPHLDQVILTARDQHAARRVPVDALDVPAVAGELALLAAAGKVPHLHAAVVRTADELVVGRTEGEVTHRLSVTLPRLDVVHVRLPVLDHAAIVRRNQPVIVVTPLHGTQSSVVRLQNGLKVERDAVP
mmetsp:Transcript_6660/g.20255  ORF Transcript_6660/g.20255 Transcript_6660/m.20255 type:complete len:241 (-) Transcript_6660:68-790(-)